MKKVIIIDGNNFSNRSGFTLEIQRKFTKDLGWVDYENADGINLDAVNDFLRGGFGVYEYEEPVKVRWINSEKSRLDLGWKETISYLNDKLKDCHPSNVKSVKTDIEEALRGKGETLFEHIVDVIKDHHHIELILE